MQNFFIILFAILTLGACGFTPVHYQSQSQKTEASQSVRADFDRIIIGVIAERQGQELRNHLIDRLYFSGRPTDPLYRLDININEPSISQRGITREATTTREQIVFTAKASLIEIETGEELLTRPFRALATYNVLAGQYATLVSQEQAQERALALMAADIERALALYFKDAQNSE